VNAEHGAPKGAALKVSSPKSTDNEGSTTIDRRLGARVAFGPASSPEMLDWLDRQGHQWLFAANDPLLAVAGGLCVRLARPERAIATFQREVA
jgi:hypothetical protein